MASNTETLSFDIPKFSTAYSSSIILQGSAKFLPNEVLALTDIPTSVGRALYSAPVHIWDSTTGNVASFTTSFTFVVADIPGYNPADGIIFFLAPEGTQIPQNDFGENLGVVNRATSVNRFVGVEFDTYQNVNLADPSYPHIGISVNSLISLKTVKWNKVSGSLVQVTISYDSLSKTLNVVVTNDDGSITTIAQVIDLKDVLPEKVNVGFSAATSSGGNQVHEIRSWSFTSTLVTI